MTPKVAPLPVPRAVLYSCGERLVVIRANLVAPFKMENTVVTDNDETKPIELATKLTIAWLSNPNTRATPEDVPAFLGRMHQAVQGLQSSLEDQPEEQAQEYKPAVSVRKSLASKDHLISMIDGKPYKTLRRHLSRHGLTPDQYRERYNLKPDYPMVSENYSQVRRDMAVTIGLGRKGGRKKAEGQPAGRRSRKSESNSSE